MTKLISIFCIFVIFQITSSAPVSDDELKLALKSLDTEQIRELARLFYDQQLKEEASNANVKEEQTLNSEKEEKEVETNLRYKTGNHPKRSQGTEQEIEETIGVSEKENPNKRVNGNHPKRSQNAEQEIEAIGISQKENNDQLANGNHPKRSQNVHQKKGELEHVKEEQREEVDDVPAAREELPEPMVAELGMVKNLRQLSDKMAQNWDTLDDLIERMETGSSKKGLYRDQAQHSSFLRRAQRLLVDLDNRQYPNDQHNLILEDMSRIIQLRMRQGNEEEENEVVEMTTIGDSLLGKEVEEEDIYPLQENYETLNVPLEQREVDKAYQGVNEREDDLMSKLESILEELMQLE